MAEVEENDDDSTGSNKKVPKKKYYPFGTPSHLHHPYSDFAHLKDRFVKDFAVTLATATDIQAEVIIEKPKKIKRPPKQSTLNGSTSGAAVEDHTDEIPDTEGIEPCTKLPCQQLLRALLDLQYKNEMERYEIEDEYERLLHELTTSMEEIGSAEQKLVQLNEIGNQLEQKHAQLKETVTELEKTKEAQINERSDINNKVK